MGMKTKTVLPSREDEEGQRENAENVCAAAGTCNVLTAVDY